MTERNHKDCRAEPCMTPDYHTRFKEDFNVADLEAAEFDVEEILAFIDEVVAEEREHEFFAGYDKGKIAGAAIERTALIKVVEGMRIEKHWRDLEPHEYYNEALDAVLAHLRTGEEEGEFARFNDEIGSAIHKSGLCCEEKTEKGGSSFSGRVNFGKPRLSNPVRPWPKETTTPSKPQDSIREETEFHACPQDEEGLCADCPCHSPRENAPTLAAEPEGHTVMDSPREEGGERCSCGGKCDGHWYTGKTERCDGVLLGGKTKCDCSLKESV